MTKRRWLVISGVCSGAVLVAISCGFPEVTYDERTDGGTPTSGEAGLEDAQTDAEAPFEPDAGPAHTDVDPNGQNADAAVLGDAATTPVDASGCTSCDCDHDGYERFQLDAGCDGSHGPIDCDDTIPGIHPNQDYILDPWPPAANNAVAIGDWNCDGKTEKKLDYSQDCTKSCKAGFKTNPDCGASGTFATCKEILSLTGIKLGCADDQTPTATQSCR